MSVFAWRTEVIRAIAEGMGMSVPNLERWLNGSGEPHDLMRPQILDRLARRDVRATSEASPKKWPWPWVEGCEACKDNALDDMEPCSKHRAPRTGEARPGGAAAHWAFLEGEHLWEESFCGEPVDSTYGTLSNEDMHAYVENHGFLPQHAGRELLRRLARTVCDLDLVTEEKESWEAKARALNRERDQPCERDGSGSGTSSERTAARNPYDSPEHTAKLQKCVDDLQASARNASESDDYLRGYSEGLDDRELPHYVTADSSSLDPLSVGDRVVVHLGVVGAIGGISVIDYSRESPYGVNIGPTFGPKQVLFRSREELIPYATLFTRPAQEKKR